MGISVIIKRRKKSILLFIAAAVFWYFVVQLFKGSTNVEVAKKWDSYRQKRYLDYMRSQANRTGPGEHGVPERLAPDEREKARYPNSVEGFNVVVSHKIALDRAIRDFRDPLCKTQEFPEHLPKASVIIIYFNEEWSAILRTAHSVVNRTPPQFLHEVLLVDDCSTRVELGEKLQQYVKTTWPDGIVKITRTKERGGLIRARLHGAEVATGQVLVFLDAHCEAHNYWMEPMLTRIAEDHTRVICPYVDMISTQDLRYSSVGSHAIGIFRWDLLFTWSSLPEREQKRRKTSIDPLRSPSMPGGLFAISKEWFFHIGSYDRGMEIWGAENLDISFRIWMCGGSLEFLPCARVGHIFRPNHPYGFPSKKDYNGLNTKRLAEVWLDDYKRMFYYRRGDLKSMDPGDLTERLALKERLKCHDFGWYLRNVFPEKYVMYENVRHFGRFRNPVSNMCIDKGAGSEESGGYALMVFPCQPDSFKQMWSITHEGVFRRESTCAINRGDKGTVYFSVCQYLKPNFTWTYDKTFRKLMQVESGKCVTLEEPKALKKVYLRDCTDSDTQIWDLLPAADS